MTEMHQSEGVSLLACTYSITGYDVIKLYHNEDVTVHTHRVQYTHTECSTHIVYFLDFLLEIVGLNVRGAFVDYDLEAAI